MNTRRGRPRHPDLLTPTEWQVVDAVRHGMSTGQIARRRGVSRDAVKFHVANALAKLGLADRAQLRAWRGVPADSALRHGAPAGPAPAATPRSKGGPIMQQTPRDPLALGPIGQISRHVSDIDRAVEWYGSVLGLPHLYTYGDLAFFDCDGVRLFLSTGQVAGAESAIVYFRVPDIQAAYDELGARGIAFQGAPHMIFRHDSGVEEWMAFFADPDGQPLAIMARTPGDDEA